MKQNPQQLNLKDLKLSANQLLSKSIITNLFHKKNSASTGNATTTFKSLQKQQIVENKYLVPSNKLFNKGTYTSKKETSNNLSNSNSKIKIEQESMFKSLPNRSLQHSRTPSKTKISSPTLLNKSSQQYIQQQIDILKSILMKKKVSELYIKQKSKSPIAPQQSQQLTKINANQFNQQLLKKLKNQRSVSSPALQIQDKVIKSIGAFSQPGKNNLKQEKTNQDSYAIIEMFQKKTNQLYLQVSDGHGINGHLVAQFIKERLPSNVEQVLNQYYIPNDASDIKTDQQQISNHIKSLVNAIMRQSFEKTSKELLYNSEIDTTFSGATTVSLLLIDNILWCSNIGDSRAILCRKNQNSENGFQIIELSHDHKPELPSEHQRIIKHGGRVQPYSDENGNPFGPYRVWMKVIKWEFKYLNQDQNIPGLAMARSFGDYVASQVGVIAIPEILRKKLDQDDLFLVIASDGIWEFLNNDQVATIVLKEFYQQNDPQGACKQLVQTAIKAWEEEDEVIDDITCIVVFLNDQEIVLK